MCTIVSHIEVTVHFSIFFFIFCIYLIVCTHFSPLNFCPSFFQTISRLSLLCFSLPFAPSFSLLHFFSFLSLSNRISYFKILVTFLWVWWVFFSLISFDGCHFFPALLIIWSWTTLVCQWITLAFCAFLEPVSSTLICFSYLFFPHHHTISYCWSLPPS